MSAAPEERRDRAVWLAELATWRRGLVGALVGECGDMGAVLALPPGAVAAAARARGRRAASQRKKDGAARGDDAAGAERGRRGTVAGRDPESAEDTSLFAALLARGPVAGAAGRPDVVTWVDETYPPQLRDLPDPPPALFLGGLTAAGLRALAERHIVAVVGSRSPSVYGREMARAIARDLTAAGVLVVSGLALGIDATAHEAALDAAAGRQPGTIATVAVLGCGADVEHPPSNRRLFARVRGNGMVVSECGWGAGARPWRFPARNRVMAALSEAVVVVEGAERSGALITAREALDLGRDVFAVPGEAGRRLSAGPHWLLRQGAALCESARDVLEVLGFGGLALGWGRGATSAATDGTDEAGDAFGVADAGDAGAPGSSADRRLVAALDDGIKTVDQLAAVTRSDVAVTLARLAVLEVGGVVQACGGGTYRLRRGT